MSDIFTTEKIKAIWVAQEKEIGEYYNFIEAFNFRNAINIGNECLEKFNHIESKLKPSETESVLNDCYFFKIVLHILIEYSTYWENVNQNGCSESWDALQNAQDYLRTINKFTKANSTKFFSFYENQFANLEKVYPYNLFASPYTSVIFCFLSRFDS